MKLLESGLGLQFYLQQASPTDRGSKRTGQRVSWQGSHLPVTHRDVGGGLTCNCLAQQTIGGGFHWGAAQGNCHCPWPPDGAPSGLALHSWACLVCLGNLEDLEQGQVILVVVVVGGQARHVDKDGMKTLSGNDRLVPAAPQTLRFKYRHLNSMP